MLIFLYFSAFSAAKKINKAAEHAEKSRKVLIAYYIKIWRLPLFKPA